MNIADALNRLLKEEGLNNLSFAQLLGVNPPCTSRYLSGSRIPPLNRLKQIAKVFNRKLILEFTLDEIQAKFVLKESIREISFDDKLQQCHMPLMRYCMNRMFLRKEDAEDVTQETLYRALKLHNTWNPEVAIMTWLIAIAKNVKSRKMSKLMFIDDYLKFDKLCDESEETFRHNPNLFNYIDEMNPANKEICKLYLTGVPYTTIAKQVNSSEGAIKMRIKNIKKYLRLKTERDMLCNSN